jgi:hypothetical protein
LHSCNIESAPQGTRWSLISQSFRPKKIAKTLGFVGVYHHF